MFIDQLMQNPHKLTYEEQEKYADHLVKHLSGMTYEQAWWLLDGHKKIYDEAVKHLNHNAAIEMRSNPIKYVLEE